MQGTIKALANTILETNRLKGELNNPAYWIDKAQKEAGLVVKENDKPWIHIEISWAIRVDVHTNYSGGMSRYWVNGKWFTTAFPDYSECPSYQDLLQQ